MEKYDSEITITLVMLLNQLPEDVILIKLWINI